MFSRLASPINRVGSLLRVPECSEKLARNLHWQVENTEQYTVTTVYNSHRTKKNWGVDFGYGNDSIFLIGEIEKYPIHLILKIQVRPFYMSDDPDDEKIYFERFPDDPQWVKKKKVSKNPKTNSKFPSNWGLEECYQYLKG